MKHKLWQCFFFLLLLPALLGCDIEDIPAYSGETYIELQKGIPEFSKEDLTDKNFEEYSDLDDLGRCGTAYANICQDIMPTEERGPIGQIKPSGWHTVKYNDLIDGNYLYNRCHLIGYQLAGENANEKNLITGTRYFNVEGMLPFENMVAEYIQDTNNHVLYRVTPVFEGDNLVAKGVIMEGESVEDQGEGICFHVFVYNVQPGIHIDYATGESEIDQESAVAEQEEENYILNINTHKFHLPGCASVSDMKEKNKKSSTKTRAELMKGGYSPCKRCLNSKSY